MIDPVRMEALKRFLDSTLCLPDGMQSPYMLILARPGKLPGVPFGADIVSNMTPEEMDAVISAMNAMPATHGTEIHLTSCDEIAAFMVEAQHSVSGSS